MLEKFYRLVSNDIGIDLGTANTLVYLRGHGIVINEPSIVALNKKTGRIVAVGHEAKQMLGRTPEHIEAIRPVIDGVISDFEVTEEMLAYLIGKAEKLSKKILKPRVVIGVPPGITNVEIRAVYDAAKSAGARDIHIIEEPMAAAIGMHLPVHDPVGSMVIDIGGGTTDIAIISLGGIVKSRSFKIAGDRFNTDIITYLKNEFKILIGDKTAENLKITLGTMEKNNPLETEVKGRDLITGLPREITVSDSDIRDALTNSITTLMTGIKEVLEMTPPEILGDIMHRGVFISGGGALIRGIDELFHRVLKIPVFIADDPLSAVARGCGIILEDIQRYESILLDDYDHISPQ